MTDSVLDAAPVVHRSAADAAAHLRTALQRVTPVLKQRAAEVDEHARFPFDNLRTLHEAGLLSAGLSLARGGVGFGRDLPFTHFFNAVIDIARACSNTAQLYTVQTGALFTLELLGASDLLDEIAADVRKHGKTFCFTAAEPDERFTYDNKRTNLKSFAEPLADGRWRVKAEKAFATGSPGCGYALFQCSTVQDDGGKPPESVLVLLPRDHPAVQVYDTWDGIGQRATGSGKLVVEESIVEPRWIIGNPASVPAAAILAPLYQLGFAAILTGIGEAALDDTLEFVHTTLKPTNGYARAAEEPALQAHVADVRIALSASRALIGEAARAMDAFTRGEADIAEVLIAVYQAKVHASGSSLEAGSRLFQIGGARSATRRVAADRHWRNARTLTLHDSVDKQKGVVARHVLGVERPNVSTR
ncbi:acyl-CoA dehydrogenase family protein [Paraburkholderia sp. BCC1886]|uniref:acyl-CoA dehydrogenase family protein n=1 Tax=Paraburkholderia sp. BCC1886 TaxID=2562670 RepID=UPI00118223E9|nr:acyl-CoA dehydrogenase family protein [Paraburkholderia sp. BCC1886]